MEVLLVYLAGCPDASLPSLLHPPKPSFFKKTKHQIQTQTILNNEGDLYMSIFIAMCVAHF